MRRNKHTPWLHRWSRLIIGGIATTGAAVTAYLTIEKLFGNKVVCPTEGCEQVLNSPYATVFGQPLALWGFLTYVTVIMLALAPFLFRSADAKERRHTVERTTAWLLLAITTGMVVFSSYLMYLLAFEIRAVCTYCVASAFFSLSLWLLTLNGREWPDLGQLWFTSGIVAMLALVATLVVYNPKVDRTVAAELGQPISAQIWDDLKQASEQGLSNTGAAQPGLLQAIAPAHAAAATSDEVLYVGTDYCPFCAGSRWPLVVALLRFGEFDQLRYMQSSAIDSYPNTPTFTFHESNYQSPILKFKGLEVKDREGNPLEEPTPEHLQIIQTLNAAPYTNSPGAVPFLYIGGRYVQIGASFRPDAFQGLSWTEIAEQLTDPTSAIAQVTMPSANQLTAAFCQLTDQQPEAVCQAPGVTAAATTLPG